MQKVTIYGTEIDYINNFVYENGSLIYILNSEGRIVYHSGATSYQYFLKDHLGNVRVVFDENLLIKQINSYYPFGMRHIPTLLDDATQKYLYNGKEMQEDLGCLDYHARSYDPTLGRFLTIDRLAGKYPAITPYHYTLNNPIGNIDPNGMTTMSSLLIMKDEIFGPGIRRDKDEGSDNSNNNSNQPNENSLAFNPSGNFINDFFNLVGKAFLEVFFDEEEFQDGKTGLIVDDEVSAVINGPVALIISGNIAAQMFTGGVDVEGGVVIILSGEDKGVYPLADVGIPIISNEISATISGKIMPVFTEIPHNKFQITDLIGARAEYNMGIPYSNITFGGFQSLFSESTSTFGFYVGYGNSFGLKNVTKINLPSNFQMNIGGTEIFYNNK